MAAIRAVKGAHAASSVWKLPPKNQKGMVSKQLPKELFHQIQQYFAVEKGVRTERITPIKELQKSLLSNQIDQVKTLFAQVVERDENTQSDLTSLYHSLKSDSKTKEAYATFKKLYTEHIIEQTVLERNVKLLQSPLAQECKIRETTKEQLVATLDAVADQKGVRLARTIEAISKIPFEKHKLIPIDMLEVCVAAERKLLNLSNRTKTVYVRADKLHACRSCVLDPVRHTFTILSKHHGDLSAEGAFKRVSDAVEVALRKSTAAARRVAHVRNKPYEEITTSELKYELAFGKIISWTRYKAKNRNYERKTLMLQDVYDHDLYIFTEFTPEQKRKTISLEDLIQVLEDAGKTLLQMHESGLVHRDVKAKNILYRKDENGKVHGKLIDFGHVYVPDDTTHVRKRTKGYGTLRYTAPDLLENPEMKGDPLFLAKAEDAYALGECIYEVYLQQANPWGSITWKALKKKKNADENRATAIKLQKEEAAWLAKEAAKGPQTAEKELLAITAKLLEPNPKKRMQIPEFMRALYDLKAKYATLSTVVKN